MSHRSESTLTSRVRREQRVLTRESALFSLRATLPLSVPISATHVRFGAASVAAHFDPECDGWRSSAHVSQLACGALFGEEASISARKHGRNGDGGGGVGSSAGVLSVCVHTVTRAGRPKKRRNFGFGFSVQNKVPRNSVQFGETAAVCSVARST